MRPKTEIVDRNVVTPSGKRCLTPVIGYVRVSTEKQNLEDLALKRQSRLIKDFAAARGFDLLGIYDDVGSAAESFSSDRRGGLKAATEHATREKAAIVVTEPTRLFRDRVAAENWIGQFDGDIWSIKDQISPTREEFLESVAVGEAHAAGLRQATTSALNERRTQGRALGSPADKSKANAASARARALRSADIVAVISNILREDRVYRDLSHRALADLLNRRGVLTGWSRPWTAESIRRSRMLAEERIAENEAIETESAPVFMPEAPVPDTSQTNETEKEAAELEAMRRLPYYSMF